MDEICKIKDLYRTLYIFEKDFQQKYKITINEAMLLCALKDGQPRSANELCEFIGLSNSRGSRIINTSEAKKLIDREMGKDDKRKMIFNLSDSGKIKVSEMAKEELVISNQLRDLLK